MTMARNIKRRFILEYAYNKATKRHAYQSVSCEVDFADSNAQALPEIMYRLEPIKMKKARKPKWR